MVLVVIVWTVCEVELEVLVMAEAMARFPAGLYCWMNSSWPAGAVTLPAVKVEVLAPTLGVTRIPPVEMLLLPISVSVEAPGVLKRTLAVLPAFTSAKLEMTSVCVPVDQVLLV